MATAKTAFLAAADDEFFEELKNGTSGYATVSLRQLINHIRDEYDDYDADVRKNLNEQLTLPWDGGKLTTVIARINAVASIHAAHNQPLSEQQKCDALHNAVRAHGSLNKECTKWTSKPVADHDKQESRGTARCIGEDRNCIGRPARVWLLLVLRYSSIGLLNRNIQFGAISTWEGSLSCLVELKSPFVQLSLNRFEGILDISFRA